MRIEDAGGIDARQYVAGSIAHVVGQAAFNGPSAVRLRVRTNEAVYHLRTDAARLTMLAESLNRLNRW